MQCMIALDAMDLDAYQLCMGFTLSIRRHNFYVQVCSVFKSKMCSIKCHFPVLEEVPPLL